MLYNSKNSYVRTDEKLVVASGLEDLFIISTKDALLVAQKESTQNVKTIVQHLKSDSRSEWELHREVYRPWGKYELIHIGERSQVKRITVNPGAKLSVQKHIYRSEHWTVVSGKAKVRNGDKIFLLDENESTYIPIGVIHSLENETSQLLEIIEMQTGTYLGEDDIIRLDDKYGRTFLN